MEIPAPEKRSSDQEAPYPSILNTCDLTAAVTCYNEQDLVIETIETLVASLRGFDFTWEIVVIDDASTDASVEQIRGFAETNPDIPLRLYVNDVNRGFGFAIVEGAYLGVGDWYRVCCGDGGEPKETFDAIFSHLGEVDVVIPWLERADGKSFFRRCLSGTYTSLINLLSGHRLRYYNGLYLGRRTDFMRFSSNYNGFGAQADVLCGMLNNGRTYVEVPIRCVERKQGASEALRLRNVLSVSLTIFDMVITRLGRLLYPASKTKSHDPPALAAQSPAAAKLRFRIVQAKKEIADS